MSEMWPKDPGAAAERRRHDALASSSKSIERQIDRDGEYIPHRDKGKPKLPCAHCGQDSRQLDADNLCPRCRHILGVPSVDAVEELDDDDELQELIVEGDPWTVWIHDLDAGKRSIGSLLSGKDSTGRSVVGRVVKVDPSTFRVMIREATKERA